MENVAIREGYITFGDVHYFTLNANKVSLGSYGKKTKITFGDNKGQHQFEVKGQSPAPRFEGRIKIVLADGMETDPSSQGKFMKMAGSLRAIGFDGSPNAIYDELAHNRLKFVLIYVEENAMLKVITDFKLMDKLELLGSEVRVVHQLFVVMEAEFAASFSGGTKHNVSIDPSGFMTIKASGGKTVQDKDTLTFSPGTCFAYLLLSLDWDQKRTTILKVDTDSWTAN